MIYTVADVNPAVVEWQTARNVRFMTDSRVAEFFAERGQRFVRWTKDFSLEVEPLTA